MKTKMILCSFVLLLLFFSRNALGGQETAFNTFYGLFAGANIKDGGNYNTFIGHSAGAINTTGSYNTFLGFQAGAVNQPIVGDLDSASNNTFLGYQAGKTNSTGKFTLQSSREVKDEIEPLTVQEATDALEELRPVTFVYRADREERHAGFIAEDLPEPVATKDRKGVNPMDIVTVLTRVLQEQQKIVEQQQGMISAHAEKIAKLERLLAAKGN